MVLLDDMILENYEVIEEDQEELYEPIEEIKTKDIEENSSRDIQEEKKDSLVEKKEEININESESSYLICGGDVIFNVDNVEVSNLKSASRSAGTFEFENYDTSNLWTNKSPTSNFGSQVITLNDSINNYDLLAFECKLNTSSNNTFTLFLSVNDFKNRSSSGKDFRVCSVSTQGNYSLHYRIFNYSSDTSINVSNAFMDQYQQSYGNGYNIPLNVYGLKAKVINEPTQEPTQKPLSGNTIINNYYGCVSDNSLSYNIMNKPLNQYNTAESFCAFGCLFALGIGLYLLIRKVIFKWQ